MRFSWRGAQNSATEGGKVMSIAAQKPCYNALFADGAGMDEVPTATVQSVRVRGMKAARMVTRLACKLPVDKLTGRQTRGLEFCARVLEQIVLEDDAQEGSHRPR
jgi:hypothetical protein